MQLPPESRRRAHFTSSLCATRRASAAKLLNLRRRESFDPYRYDKDDLHSVETRLSTIPYLCVYVYKIYLYVKYLCVSWSFGHLNEGINVEININIERKDRKSRREFLKNGSIDI